MWKMSLILYILLNLMLQTKIHFKLTLVCNILYANFKNSWKELNHNMKWDLYF